ncbi:MAG: hypothetical protein R2704_05930 [Microthrixaceae bacterium]
MVAALLLGACGNDVDGDDTASGDVTTTEATETTNQAPQDPEAPAEPALLADAEVGTCYQLEDLATTGVDLPVDCDSPHDGQLFAKIDPGSEVLGDDSASRFYPACDEELTKITGRSDDEDPTLQLAFLVDGTAGGPPESDVGCFVTTKNDDMIRGDVFDTDLADLIGDYRALHTLSFGDCFELGEAFNVGVVVECTPGALTYVGSFDAADFIESEEYPGEDELRELRGEECPNQWVGGERSGQPRVMSGTMPSQVEWDYQRWTVITCDYEGY